LLIVFSSECYECRKEGHRANNHQERKKNDAGNNFGRKMKCLNCGNLGHTAGDCWYMKAN
jgi:hypothetical protein